MFILLASVNMDSISNGSQNENGPPPIPPRRKHSGKLLKQQAENSSSLSNQNPQFGGLPPIPKVKVSLKIARFSLIYISHRLILSFLDGCWFS